MDSTPMYTPHTTVNYGSTGHNTNTPVSLYTIFVIHNGQSTCEAFSVKAISTDTVDELKKLIKAAKAPLFDNCPADKLKLVGVSIPDDPSKEHEKICLKHLAYTRPLRATEVLEDLFLGRLPEKGRIHVVIETNEPKFTHAHSDMNDQQGSLYINIILNFIMEVRSSDKVEMDEHNTHTSVHQQQGQQPQQTHPRPQQAHTIVPLDSLAASPTQTALALPSCPDQPAETNDLPYPVLPTTTSDPISSYPALPVATPSSTNTEDTLSYPLESLDIIEPLSNPLPLDPSTPLTLFCLVDGQTTKQTWSIKALPADTVDDMKKAVKLAQAPNFDHMTSGDLHLHKINVENDPEHNTLPVHIKSVNHKELNAMDTVAEIYPRGTTRKVVQLMVMKPSPKPYVGGGNGGGRGCGGCEAVLMLIGLVVIIVAVVSGKDIF
ncbi:hypothetical protein BGZ81_009176 [Podila clonocystis]|nr:hypothetical protein BGZ81_009176 [Podila clonocystis]